MSEQQQNLDSLLGLLDDKEDNSNPIVSNNKRCSSFGEQSAYFSAAEENSWLDNTDDSMKDEDHDKTISPPKQPQQYRNTTTIEQDQSEQDLQRELEELEKRKEEIKNRLKMRTKSGNNSPKASSTKLRIVPLDFSAPVDIPKSKKFESVVHKGDTSSSEDEVQRNPDNNFKHLTSEGRHLKRKMRFEQMNKANGDINSLRQQAIKTGKKIENSAAVGTGINKDVALFDSFFGLRVKAPKVSSHTFSTYLADRQTIRLSNLRIGQSPLGDWVAMGVLIEKSTSRTSANGNQYAIWRVSDMKDCQETPIKLWLFGDCLKQHWKLSVGTVVALFGPTFMESQDKQNGAESSIRLKLSLKHQILELGPCPDFGFCRSKRKDGKQCQNFVNKSQGDHCTFHLVSASKTYAARRGELQSASNIPPKSWTKKALSGGVTSDPVFQARGVKGYRKPPPLTLEQIRGSRRVNKVVAETRAEVKKDMATRGAKTKPILDKSNEVESPLVKLLQVSTAGSRNLIRHLSSSNDDEKTKVKKEANTATSMREFLSRRMAAEKAVPTLARGLSSDESIDVSMSVKSNKDTFTSVRERREKLRDQLAKHKALSILRRKKDSHQSVKRNREQQTKRNESAPEVDSNNSQPTATERSPIKKRTRFGEVNLSKERIQALLEKKSTHEAELNEEDSKKEEQYFNLMEAKERVEQKMVDTTEIKNCNVISCKKCKYTWHSQSDFCKQQGHLIERHTADKRFFKCRHCSKRTICYTKYPTKPCKECGANGFDRTGMKEERKGPIEEKLKVRGDEVPFVNR